MAHEKPVTISAQREGGPVAGRFRKKPLFVEAYRAESAGWLETLDSHVPYVAGDWIVTTAEGEQYLWGDDIFRETFTPVGMDWATWDSLVQEGIGANGEPEAD